MPPVNHESATDALCCSMLFSSLLKFIRRHTATSLPVAPISLTASRSRATFWLRPNTSRTGLKLLAKEGKQPKYVVFFRPHRHPLYFPTSTTKHTILLNVGGPKNTNLQRVKSTAIITIRQKTSTARTQGVQWLALIVWSSGVTRHTFQSANPSQRQTIRDVARFSALWRNSAGIRRFKA